MFKEFVQRNVVQVDAMIEQALERLAEHEKMKSRREGIDETRERMRQGVKTLKAYRNYISRMC